MRRLVWIILTAQLSLLAIAQTTQTRSWQVMLADESNTKLVVSNNSGMIEFRNEQAVALAIPAGSITGIIHLTQHVRRSTKAYNRLEQMCCAGGDTHLLSLLAMAIAAPLGHSKGHYVEI